MSDFWLNDANDANDGMMRMVRMMNLFLQAFAGGHDA